jgi:hypothetical protein
VGAVPRKLFADIVVRTFPLSRRGGGGTYSRRLSKYFRYTLLTAARCGIQKTVFKLAHVTSLSLQERERSILSPASWRLSRVWTVQRGYTCESLELAAKCADCVHFICVREVVYTHGGFHFPVCWRLEFSGPGSHSC